MAVTLRLKRCGSKGQPFYRVVAIDSRKKRDGRNIEIVGTYNPADDPPTIVLKKDRIQYWLECGAQPSATVRRLLRQTKPAAEAGT